MEESIDERMGFDHSSRAYYIISLWRSYILAYLIVMQGVFSTKIANLLTKCHPVCKANFDKVAFFSYVFLNKV